MIPVEGGGGPNVEGRAGHPSCSYTLSEIANIKNVVIFLVFVLLKCSWQISWQEGKFRGDGIP